nr:sigma-70 family RNA polymerase sigma factor [Rhodococcus sp. (in: high G+C Gram-positive bacteria)]
MDDAKIVTALTDGDLSALGDAYDRYAQRLFTYANALLRDEHLAADVVHDSMLIASQRIGKLREPDHFRSWLYAVVRSECLRQLALTKTNVSFDGDVGLTAAELESSALNSTDLEILELAVRHDLDIAEVAAVLRVGMRRASRLTSRAGTRLERSLPVGQGPSAAPLAAVPFWLRDLVVADAQVSFELDSMARRIDPLDRAGFPQPNKQRVAGHAPQGVWVGAAGAAVVVGVGVGLMLVGPAKIQSPLPAQFVDAPATPVLLSASPPSPAAPAQLRAPQSPADEQIPDVHESVDPLPVPLPVTPPPVTPPPAGPLSTSPVVVPTTTPVLPTTEVPVVTTTVAPAPTTTTTSTPPPVPSTPTVSPESPP